MNTGVYLHFNEYFFHHRFSYILSYLAFFFHPTSACTWARISSCHFIGWLVTHHPWEQSHKKSNTHLNTQRMTDLLWHLEKKS